MDGVVSMLMSSAQHNATAGAAGTAGAVYGNPIFQGGFLLLIAGVLMNMVSGYFSLAVSFLCEQLMTHIDVTKDEDAYDWLLDWLASQPKNMFTTQRLSLSVHQKKSSSHQWKKQMNLELVTKERPKIKYLPGSGMHILFFNGAIVWLYRNIKDVPAAPSPYGHLGGTSQTRESLSIVTIGRSKSTIDKLIQTAMSFSLDKDVGNTVIYNVDSAYGSGWSRATAKECRSMDSVILDVDMSEELIEDATEFLSCGDWYRQLGIPYRRTYLFHGKPGCGKTSFVAALAAKLKLNVCVLSLSAQNMNDAMVNQLLLEAPVNAMVLLEDVDVAFPSREEQDDTKSDPWGFRMTNNKITFSGLINAIDGIASQEGRIFIMTTNYKKRLDPALLRPGRVDKSIHFPLASVSQIRRMFLRFYPKEDGLAEKFADRIGPNKVSMAQLQGYFLAYKNKPLEAFNHCDQILQQITEEEEARKKKKLKKKKEKEEKEKAKVGDLSSLVKIIEAVKEKDEGGEKESNGEKKKTEAGHEEKGKEKEETKEIEEKGKEEKANGNSTS